MECSTVLLAGGEGKRFTKNRDEYKAFIIYHGLPFFLRVLKKIPSSASHDVTIVTTKSHVKKFNDLIGQFKYQPLPKIVFDEPPFQGPMNGIIKGMQSAFHDNCLVVPCDIPLLKTKVLQDLINRFEQIKNAPGIIPRWSNGYREPLTAIYRKKFLFEPLLREFEQGERKIQNVLDSLSGIEYVEIDQFRTIDPALHSFCNINTNEDYHNLESIQ